MNPYSNNSMPSAKLPSRPTYGNTGEEYPMQQVSFNNTSNPSPFAPPQDNVFFDPPNNNEAQRPLLVNTNSNASSVTLNNGNGSGVRFTNAKSNMSGGGPENMGIGRRQTRRYKTSKCSDRVMICTHSFY